MEPSSSPSTYESRFLPDISDSARRWLTKIILIAVALMLLQIPLHMVSKLSATRRKNADKVQSEISSVWGAAQTVSIDSEADKIAVEAEMFPEIRYRGIYHVTVYTASININASYKNAKPSGNIKIGVSDIRGVQSVSAEVNGKALQTSVRNGQIIIPVAPAAGENCRIALKIRGSWNLKFAPQNDTASVKISGKWSSPGFDGSVLPETRDIRDNFFSAGWELNKQFSSAAPVAGVNLCLPAGAYQQLERLMSYATFFLIVFFCTLLVSEIITKTDIHPLQYIVAAGAPVLFYLMVLALSEHIGFTAGYIVSAAAVVLMVTGYSRMFLGRVLPALLGGIIFALSYFLNFIILRMEEYSLLAGTIVLAVILGIVMALTGKINRKVQP